MGMTARVVTRTMNATNEINSLTDGNGNHVKTTYPTGDVYGSKLKRYGEVGERNAFEPPSYLKGYSSVDGKMNIMN